MGDLFRFKSRPRWTRFEDYGRRQRMPRFWPQQRSGFGFARPLLLLVSLAGAYAISDPDLVEPPHFLAREPELVTEQFTRCGPGRPSSTSPLKNSRSS